MATPTVSQLVHKMIKDAKETVFHMDDRARCGGEHDPGDVPKKVSLKYKGCAVFGTVDRYVWAVLSPSGAFDTFPKGLEPAITRRRVDQFINQNYMPEAFLVRHGNKYIYVENGDDDDATTTPTMNGIVLSFRCLGRFFAENNVKADDKVSLAGAKAFQRATVLDFTPPETKGLSPEQKNIAGNEPMSVCRKKFTAPTGFVLIHNLNSGGAYVWHRSGSVLLGFGNKRILMGVDDDAYFGCELAQKVDTLKAAYKSLIPKPLQSRNGWVRQGEWFVTPVPLTQVPKVTECIAHQDARSGETAYVSLPVDDEASALHIIETENLRIISPRTEKDGVGIFALSPSVEHNEGDHPDVDKKGWCVFHRNTAKRSFTEAGVD